jgi:hypothetical protein
MWSYFDHWELLKVREEKGVTVAVVCNSVTEELRLRCEPVKQAKTATETETETRFPSFGKKLSETEQPNR